MEKESEEQSELDEVERLRIEGYTIGYVTTVLFFESDRIKSSLVRILQELPAKISFNIANDLRISITMARYMVILETVKDLLVAEENDIKEHPSQY